MHLAIWVLILSQYSVFKQQLFVCHIQIKLKINFDLVDETAVDETGVDKTMVDKAGVDEPEKYPYVCFRASF